MSKKQRFTKVALADLIEDPKYQALPSWDTDLMTLTVQQLRREEDVRVPIIIDEGNRILDGHQRFAAAKEARLSHITCDRVEGLDDTEKLRYVFGQLHRRHLSRSELREAARQAVLRMHEYADARISLTIGIVTDKTVRSIRTELVNANLIPDHDTLIAVGGTRQKANKVRKASTKPGGETKSEPVKDTTKDEGQQETKAGEAGNKGQGQQGGTVQGQEGEKGAGSDSVVPTKPTILLPSTPGIILPSGPFGVPHTGAGILLPIGSAGVSPIGSGVLLTPELPITEEAKAKPGRKSATTITRSPLEFRVEPGRLVLEGKDLDKLPAGLKEVLFLVAHDADATQVNVALGTALATLVIHCPDQK